MKIDNGVLSAISIIMVPILVVELSLAADSLPIVPGAAGFGMETPAGSGRHLGQPQTRVIKVTNLKDSGPGSLRAALTSEGPRVIIFEVSGYIALEGGITISHPYLTVAGQTAPWPGVIVRGGYTIHVGTHDVLIQHLGFRPGGQISGRYIPHRGAVSVNGENVIIDHCSMGWSQQAAVNVNRSNVTIRLSVFSEGLYNAGHNEANHSKGIGIGLGHQTVRGQRQSIAIIGNLFAHTEDRNPQVSQNSSVAIVNNVVYNWAATGVKMMKDPLTATISSNVFALGIDTGGDPQRPWRGKAAWIYLSHPESRVFLSPDNLIGGLTYDNPWEHINARRTMGQPDSKPEPEAIVWEPPVVIPGYAVKPARATEEWVLANVGPYPAHRGPIDARIVYEVRTRTGRGRDDLDDLGGWPELGENRRELILPENLNGDDDADSYTNLEEWLHAFADEVEGRKGPMVEADPDLGRREAKRCAKRAGFLDPEKVKKIRETKAEWTFDVTEAKRRQQAAAQATGLPVTRRVDLGEGLTIDLTLIPAGEFMMGSKYPPAVTKARGPGGVTLYSREYPARHVRITKHYYMGQYEVTHGIWAAVMNVETAADPHLPVRLKTGWQTKEDGENIDVFLRRLNETLGEPVRLTFRLPTEAEWEYACRAGSDAPFWFGEVLTPELANYNDAPWYREPKEMPYRSRGRILEKAPRNQMMPVGSFAPNPWGLYDTVGNAAELVQGHFGLYREGGGMLVDPQKSTRSVWGGTRITRGGNCNSYPADCRSAYGSYLAVYGGRERAGLRLVAVPADAGDV